MTYNTTPLRKTNSRAELPVPEPTYFNWSPEGYGGAVRDYEPSAQGVLTYCIPRVHVSVTEEFMRCTLGDYFDHYTMLPEFSSYPTTFDCCEIDRIDFVAIDGNAHFKQAFVYHVPLSAQDKKDHQTRLREAMNGKWYRGYPAMMDIVNRITKDIFASEYKRDALKVKIKHNGRDNFWMLLPNRNPMTMSQLEMTGKIAEENEKLMTGLALLNEAGIPLPTSFDESVLEYKKIDTAWQSHRASMEQLMDKLVALKTENKKIHDFANHNGGLTAEDIKAMEDYEKEMEEEDKRIAQMYENAAAPQETDDKESMSSM